MTILAKVTVRFDEEPVGGSSHVAVGGDSMWRQRDLDGPEVSVSLFEMKDNIAHLAVDMTGFPTTMLSANGPTEYGVPFGVHPPIAYISVELVEAEA